MPVTQVAARVDAEEITVHQLNNVLARMPNLPPEAVERAKKEVLDRLIDQQLARQQAIARKLDRTPAVQQAIEAAKNEILARAYLDQVTASQPGPTDEEVRKYYAEHPELFAQRRLFSLEEISLPGTAEVAGLRELAAKARSMQEISDWLSARNVRFAANRGVRAAEQLPLELLPRLHAAKDGDILLIDTPGARQIVRVTASRSEPVAEATAAPRIRQYLANRRASEAIAKEMKQLKDGAKIEFLGEFAGGAAAAEVKAKAETAAKAKAEATDKAKLEAEAAARAAEATKARRAAEDKVRLEAESKARSEAPKLQQLPQKSIEKGVGGLR